MSYGIIHREIFQSSLAQNCEARWVFQDMVILADEEDNVMMNDENISYTIRCPLDRVRAALAFLTAPDEDSKGKLEDGRRLLEIRNENSGRVIGFHVVNRHHYKRLISRKRRTEYMRRYRARKQDQEWERRINGKEKAEPRLLPDGTQDSGRGHSQA